MMEFDKKIQQAIDNFISGKSSIIEVQDVQDLTIDNSFFSSIKSSKSIKVKILNIDGSLIINYNNEIQIDIEIDNNSIKGKKLNLKILDSSLRSISVSYVLIESLQIENSRINIDNLHNYDLTSDHGGVHVRFSLIFETKITRSKISKLHIEESTLYVKVPVSGDVLMSLRDSEFGLFKLTAIKIDEHAQNVLKIHFFNTSVLKMLSIENLVERNRLKINFESQLTTFESKLSVLSFLEVKKSNIYSLQFNRYSIKRIVIDHIIDSSNSNDISNIGLLSLKSSEVDVFEVNCIILDSFCSLP
jgi:hypothetical protein